MAAQRLMRRLPVGESVVEAILDLVRVGPPGRRRRRRSPASRLGPRPARRPVADAGRARPRPASRAASRPSLDDVVALAEPVLKHRIALTFAARAEGETVDGLIRRLVGTDRLRQELMIKVRVLDADGADGRASAGDRRARPRAPPAPHRHRGAAHRRHRRPRHPRPPAGRAGRGVLAVPRLHRRRARQPHRLAPLRARRPLLRARARVGGGAHGLAVDRPLALHGLSPPRSPWRPRSSARWCSASRWPTSWCAAASASAIMGLTNPIASRAHRRPAGRGASPPTGRPPTCRPAPPLPPLTEAVLIGDFLTPAARVREAIERLVGARRARPCACWSSTRSRRPSPSRARPCWPTSRGPTRCASATPARSATLYLERMRDASRRAARGLRPAGLELRRAPHRPAGFRGAAGARQPHRRPRRRGRRSVAGRGELTHVRGPAPRLLHPGRPARAGRAAGALAAAARDAAAAAAHRLPAAEADPRPRAAAGDAGAHAVVAAAAAPHRRRARDPRHGRPGLEPRQGRGRGQRARWSSSSTTAGRPRPTGPSASTAAEDLRARRRPRRPARRRRRDGRDRRRTSRWPMPARRWSGCAPCSPRPTRRTGWPCSLPLQRFLARETAAEIVWISDGVSRRRAPATSHGAQGAVAQDRTLTVLAGPAARPLALAGVDNTAAGLTVRVLRAEPNGRDARHASAPPTGAACRWARRRSPSPPARRRRRPLIKLPVDLRNDIARLDIAEERTAGAVALVDESSRRRRVGLVSGAHRRHGAAAAVADLLRRQGARALRRRARAPHGAGRGDRARCSTRRCRCSCWPTSARCRPTCASGCAQYVDERRRAAALRRLAARRGGRRRPRRRCSLRRGGRALGGALSWDSPRTLAPFDRASPFYGLDAAQGRRHHPPAPRRARRRPRRARPGRRWPTARRSSPPSGAARAWSCSSTSPPTRPGRTCRSPACSSRCCAGSSALAGTGDAQAQAPAGGGAPVFAAPLRTLDGFGVFTPPPATARPIAVGGDLVGHARPSARLLRLAGRARSPSTRWPPDAVLARIDFAPLGARVEPIVREARAVDLRPWLVGARAVRLRARHHRRALARRPARLHPQRRAARPPRSRSRSPALALALAGAPGDALAQTAAARRPAARGGAPADQPQGGRRRARHPLRLCADRRCRRRRDQPRGPRRARQPSSRPARRSTRPSRPASTRRATSSRVYPLIYWPIVAGRPMPGRRRDPQARRLHEERRHGDVRHARRAAAAPGRAADARDAHRCARSSPASPCRSWSRCRATT